MRLIVLSIFTLAVLAIVLCSPIESLTIAYDLKCKSNDANSSMTHYSSLDEPTSREDENIIGYKARSFSYLEDGRINLDYIFAYNEKFNKSYGNSFVYNKININFSGAKGISELSADEFNPSNGVVSSRKRIWHEDSTFLPIKQVLGNSNHFLNIYSINNSLFNCTVVPIWSNNSRLYDNIIKSRSMNVNAKAIMGSGRNDDTYYGFDYDAVVENGTVDIANIAGTDLGSGSTNLDQSAYMKGNIALRNDLTVSDLIK